MLPATRKDSLLLFEWRKSGEQTIEHPVISAYLQHLKDPNHDYLAIAKREFSRTLNRKLDERSASKGY